MTRIAIDSRAFSSRGVVLEQQDQDTCTDNSTNEAEAELLDEVHGTSRVRRVVGRDERDDSDHQRDRNRVVKPGLALEDDPCPPELVASAQRRVHGCRVSRTERHCHEGGECPLEPQQVMGENAEDSCRCGGSGGAERENWPCFFAPRRVARRETPLKEDGVQPEYADLLERQLTQPVSRDQLEVPGDHADREKCCGPGQPNGLHQGCERDRTEKQRREDKEVREEVGEGVHRGLPTRLPGAPRSQYLPRQGRPRELGRTEREVAGPQGVPWLNARVGRDMQAEDESDNASDSLAVSVRTKWAIAFLIGIATVTAAAFTWRAAQIGSTAAYDDRQSIGETVRAEQDEVERTIEVAAAAREYVRYRADYGVAAALDRQAARLARRRIRSASQRVASRGGGPPGRRYPPRGGSGSVRACDDRKRSSEAERHSPTFDIGARRRALEAEQSTALDSPGKLDPSGFATQADDIRKRVNGLVRFAFVIAFAVLLYTLAEVSKRRRTTASFAVAGIAVYTAALIRLSLYLLLRMSEHESTTTEDLPMQGSRSRTEIEDPLKPKIAVTLAIVVVIAGMLGVLQTQAGANESTTARETTRTAVRAMSANVATSALLGVRDEVQAEHDFLPFRRPLNQAVPDLAVAAGLTNPSGSVRRDLHAAQATPDQAIAQRSGTAPARCRTSGAQTAGPGNNARYLEHKIDAVHNRSRGARRSPLPRRFWPCRRRLDPPCHLRARARDHGTGRRCGDRGSTTSQSHPRQTARSPAAAQGAVLTSDGDYKAAVAPTTGLSLRTKTSQRHTQAGLALGSSLRIPTIRSVVRSPTLAERRQQPHSTTHDARSISAQTATSSVKVSSRSSLSTAATTTRRSTAPTPRSRSTRTFPTPGS